MFAGCPEETHPSITYQAPAVYPAPGSIQEGHTNTRTAFGRGEGLESRNEPSPAAFLFLYLPGSQKTQTPKDSPTFRLSEVSQSLSLS